MSEYAVSSVMIDFWCATIRDVDPESQPFVVARILKILSLSRNASPFEPGKPLYSYRYCLRHPSGAMILWGAGSKEGVHVSFNSDALSLFSDVMHNLFRSFKFSCTRIDLCTDFYDMRASDIARNVDVVVSKSNSRTLVYDYNASSATLYIGSRSSGSRKLIRIYDKAREEARSKEVSRDVMRVELQLRHEYAEHVFNYLMASGNAVDVLASLVDFRHVTTSRVSRRPRMEFWSRFVRSARRRFIFPSSAVVTMTYERARRYLYRVAARSLAIVSFVDSSEIPRLVEAGFRKLSSAQLAYLTMT